MNGIGIVLALAGLAAITHGVSAAFGTTGLWIFGGFVLVKLGGAFLVAKEKLSKPAGKTDLRRRHG